MTGFTYSKWFSAGALRTSLILISAVCGWQIPAALGENSKLVLEEVIVTARKREESLMDVPGSVSAMTAGMLAVRSINDLQNIADFTPGFDFAQAFGRTSFRPAIRGQSTIQGEAAASLYIDGIFVGSSGATVPLTALERVEVVKGPQSALYGRRSLAGAINYVMKRPSEDFEGEAQLELGENDLVRGGLTMRGPLGDNFGYMMTLSHYEREGEYDNAFPGNEFIGSPARNDTIGDEESDSLALLLTWRPNDSLEIVGRVLYDEVDDGMYGIALQPSSFNNCFRVPEDGEQPAPPPGTPAEEANSVTSPAYNGSGYYCGSVDVEKVQKATAGDDDKAKLETGYYPDMGSEDENLRTGLTVTWNVNDAWSLVSNTGYNTTELTRAIDTTFGGQDYREGVFYGVGSPFNVCAPFLGSSCPLSRVGFITADESEFSELSQEFRLSFDDGDSLRYLVGLYYYDSEEDDVQSSTSFDGAGSVTPDGVPLFEAFDPTFTPHRESFNPVYPGAPYERQEQEAVESWSLFGSVDWDVSEQLTLGAELRYNEDEIDISGGNQNLDFNETFDATLPRFTLDYQMNDDVMLYAVVAKGNKPGTLNAQSGVPEADRAVDEETAWSYEVGAKTSWLDNRVSANVAAYFIDWEDQQSTQTSAAVVNGLNRTFTILDNLGTTEITGFEMEVNAVLTSFWDLYLGYAYTDPEIDEFVLSVEAGADAPSSFREAANIFGYQPDGTVLISGTQLPHTSEHQLTVSNSLSHDINGWPAFVRVDYIYNSERYAQVYNLADSDERNLVNVRGGINLQQLDIELWVTNLTDDDSSPALIRYVEPNNGTFNPFNRAIGVTLPRGREAGVTVRYRF